MTSVWGSGKYWLRARVKVWARVGLGFVLGLGLR